MPQVRLNADTILRLKDSKIVKRESYDEIINRLLDNNEGPAGTTFVKESKSAFATVPRIKVKPQPNKDECPSCGGTVWERGTDGKKCKNCGEIVPLEGR